MAWYVENDCALIFRNRERFGELSNMYPMAIEYGGKSWPSSEALYQALRYPGMSDLQDYIRAVPGAMEAKKRTYEHIAKTRPDWGQVKVDFMESVLRLKVVQHSVQICALLATTGAMPIVEKSYKDNFWGAIPDNCGKLEGQNVLGLLWMLIREEIRRGEFSSDVALPL